MLQVNSKETLIAFWKKVGILIILTPILFLD